MKTSKFISALLLTLVFSSCNQLKLDNTEAEQLIRKILELPKSYSYSVGWGSGVSMWGASGPLDALQAADLIAYNIDYNGAFTDPSLYLIPTDKGRAYFIGQNFNVYMFKTNDIDFDQITGISIDKEIQTATVRFTIKATNISPVAQTLKQAGYIKYSLENPLSGELKFKKFDNGWQLQTNQNISSKEIIDEILK